MRLAVPERLALLDGVLDWAAIMRGEPGWLCSELVATAAARAKLTAWLARTPTPWSTPTAGTLLTRLHFTGDEELAAATALVLAGVPPPVTSYAVEHASFLGVGRVIAGWCGARPDLGNRPFMIAVTPGDGTSDAIRTILLHEVAHCWLLAPPAPDTVAAGAFVMDTIHRTPMDAVPEAAREAVRRRRAEYATHERQADALTAVWLATSPPLPRKEPRHEDQAGQDGDRDPGHGRGDPRRPRRSASRPPAAR